ncbi:YgiQ family radical SAM protein [candidate division WOR-3 bacterium]|uniref:YgiQ family radical SAM protein n=1 Tax=candidate division WOR-3 bacterium TaxID=2052148 RepID=A0A938BQ63_UNCW3|nr:YgiQ family radical SAM protein [candidate division WOR-3 bacterium]
MLPAAPAAVVPPLSRRGMAALGWDSCDVIIVTGDAYVDHPSFGSAVVARVLLDAGFRVGVIAQPRWSGPEDFASLGRPRLFFGVTAGNVDSLVANYSPALQRRRADDFSPGGKPGLRPNRATTVYCNRLRETFGDVPLVIGGIEASLRRLAHFDHWENSVRRSILLDTRADILLYGMAEKGVVEVARRLSADSPSVPRPSPLAPSLLDGIPGSCVNRREAPADAVVLPSYEAALADRDAFNQAFRLWHREADNPSGRTVAQPHSDRWVVHYPPPPPLSQPELDHVYDLPYTRQQHPDYREKIPALETVRFSITSHRGCLGSCTFCSLSAHQGRIIQWRSRRSILAEAARITRQEGFKGHITDIGGPTANMYGATCKVMAKDRVCPDRECTWPQRCPNLRLAAKEELAVLGAVRALPGVKKVSVGTGFRFDLLDERPGLGYLEQLCNYYLSGQLRIAPEHVSSRVLAAMHKPSHTSYLAFRRRFADTNRHLGRKQYLIPYFISGHPGSTVDDALELAEFLVRTERLFIRQVQQFTPLPMTTAAAAWHTGRDPLTDKPLYVPRDPKEVRLQRALLQLHEPGNYIYAQRALQKLGRQDLLRRLRALRPLLRPARVST